MTLQIISAYEEKISFYHSFRTIEDLYVEKWSMNNSLFIDNLSNVKFL